MKGKSTLIIKTLLIIAIMIMGVFCCVQALAAQVEKIISETTTLKWESQDVTCNIPLADLQIIYTTANYKVEHYKETTEGNYILADQDTFSGLVLDDGIYTPNTYDGYVYQSELTTPGDKTIDMDGNLIIKLYYNKRTDLSYTVNHHYSRKT